MQDFGCAVEGYVASGRGLVLLAENAPRFYHAHIILELLCGTEVHLECNVEGVKVFTGGVAWPEFTKLPNAGRAILSGLENLYEGTTIAEFKALGGGFETLAKNSQNKTAVVYRDVDDQKRGRIMVDTGYTKIWEGWGTPGTARYFMNAAVWLLALDYRIQTSAPEAPFVRGALNTNLRELRPGATPKLLPQIASRLIDVIFVLDKSGSVGAGWTPTVQFVETFVKSSAVRIAEWAVNVGILCFDARITQELELTHNKLNLDSHIANLKTLRADGGDTRFDRAMQAASEMFRKSKRKNPLRILVFETDGIDSSKYSRGEDDIDTLLGVCVGPSANPDKFRSKMIKKPGDQVLQVENFANLTQIVSSIVENVKAGRG
eukprot:TRINITY_DN1507_c0_g1_i1.p1 TRINITY_DN1507_c0_g1~~TRINITY_DN1507_c0_g1_i1.p1  ORF type:complete len:376 (+),score=46.52 TRINITY_DN1507_c0_g1_i1:60-1187(+)